MIKHFTCTPFGVSDKLLQISIIGVRHHLRDRIDVFTRARLHQTRSILPSLLRHIPPVPNLTKDAEPRAHTPAGNSETARRNQTQNLKIEPAPPPGGSSRFQYVL